MPVQPSAIIVGASSGIGMELARQLAARHYRLGIAARRTDRLQQIAAELPQVGCFRKMDVSQPEAALEVFGAMLEELAPVDLIFLSAGTGFVNPSLKWELEAETVRVNVLGFTALAGRSMNFFVKQGRGHLIGITSVAAVCGSAAAPAYSASKMYGSNYLQSLRLRARRARLPIYVTEVRPGFVDTAMMKADHPFWVASPALAGRQILSAVARKKSVAYVTRRWLWVASLMRLLPESVLARMG